MFVLLRTEDWKAERVAKEGEVVVGVGAGRVIVEMAVVREGMERRRRGIRGRSIGGDEMGLGGGALEGDVWLLDLAVIATR